MTLALHHYLILAAVLFCIGLLGAFSRRNAIVVLFSVEIMLNAANLALVAFSHFRDNLDGQVMVFFIITVAAAEAALFPSQKRPAKRAKTAPQTPSGAKRANFGKLVLQKSMCTTPQTFCLERTAQGQSACPVGWVG